MRTFSSHTITVLLCATSCILTLIWTEGASAEVVGWRSDGTGKYPDANPTVEWSPDKNVVWATPTPTSSNSTPIVVGDRLFVCAEPATLLCLDAESGKPYWVQSTRGIMFSSPLVADGKVYVGTRRRKLWVFAAEKDKKVLATIDVGSPMIATPVAANDTLYVATFKKLYAVGMTAR